MPYILYHHLVKELEDTSGIN